MSLTRAVSQRRTWAGARERAAGLSVSVNITWDDASGAAALPRIA